MSEYILRERIDDNEYIIYDTNEIINLIHPDCIYDSNDGWCKCFKCEKYYDLYNENEADCFYKDHEPLFQINDCEIFECKV
ncbi:MAG: hypothetical protein ACE5J3_05810 [Methanosarcinales archaeon]